MKSVISLLLLSLTSLATIKLPHTLKSTNLLTNEKIEIPLFSENRKEFTILIFMSAKCPCSNSHVPEIQKLSKEYSNYSFFIIHSNRDENLEFSKKYFSELHLTIPVIQDEQAAIADLFKAYKTPHAFIINSTGDIIYRGGVSNSHISSNATKHYLADALQDIKSEQKIKISEAKTLGCIISRESD